MNVVSFTSPRYRSIVCRQSLIFILLILGYFNNAALAAPKPKLIPYWNVSDEQSEVRVDHSAWQNVLDKYLDTQHSSGVNRFDYANVSANDMTYLQEYLNYLQALDPRSLTKKRQFAYWVNLYNAKTTELVINAVQERGITSIKQIRSGFVWPGPWSRKSLKVGDKSLTLNNVEHGILRPIWQDHRIHYIVNCASIGCPNLPARVITQDNAQRIMQQAERVFLLHPRAVRRSDNQLLLSKIFQWYRVDFAKDDKDLLDYLRKHLDLDGLSDDLTIRYAYDWALNSIE